MVNFMLLFSRSVMSYSFASPWTIAHQAPLSMGILQAGIVEWVVIPSPGDLPDPRVKPGPPALQADSLPSESPGTIVTMALEILKGVPVNPM